MLELVAGVVAGLLVITGVLIMIGPHFPRLFGLARRRAAPRPIRGPRPPAELHPSTARALATAGRLAALLRDHGLERHAAALKLASRRLRQQETNGIYATLEILPHLRSVRLEDPGDQRIFDGLVDQLRRAVTDRAEQLELLPRH